MPPFPKHFETPKFDKYKGKGDPRDHLQEFYFACLEVAQEDTYLMRLFPKSLSGQAVEWFTHLPRGIKSFDELADKFITHFSYNCEHEISMIDLCNTKQKNGEPFAAFLQRWRALESKLPWQIPKKQFVTMFVTNLNPELAFHLQVFCASNFEELIEKGITIEKSLVAKGSIKLYDNNKNNHNNNNNTSSNNNNAQTSDKPYFWNKNKNSLNDGVTYTKAVQNVQNNPLLNISSNNVNVPRGPPRQENRPRRRFTSLGEPIADILDRCVKGRLLQLPPIRPVDESQFKPMWYDENQYCEYHRVNGHSTSNCMRLEHRIQDLIEIGKVNLQDSSNPSPNANLGAYKDPLPDHNKGKASSSTNQTYHVVPLPKMF